jgi:hypothetical protein
MYSLVFLPAVLSARKASTSEGVAMEMPLNKHAQQETQAQEDHETVDIPSDSS